MKLITSLLLFFMSFSAHALDVVSLIHGNCQVSKGVVIDVDDTNVTLIDLTENLVKVPRSQINAILIYKAVQNPFQKIPLTPAIKGYLRDIYVEDKPKPDITGWPVQFIDNIFMVFDINGKTHLLDFNHIYKVRTTAIKDTVVNLKNVNQMTFSAGNLPLNCNLGSDKGVQPAQSLIDLIRIQDYLGTAQTGFEQIRSFEERTHFYAKPILFDPNARLGFVSMNSPDQIAPTFPLYFQWSRGEPYRFQSFTKLGGGQVPESPTFSNPFVLYSEVKSHLFHGVFLGNAAALSSGSEYFTNIYMFSDGSNPESEVGKSIYGTGSYNYMALVGFDYEKWSFSFGTYYPIFLYTVRTSFFREALAHNVSPLFRIRYMSRDWEYGLIYSYTKRGVDSAVDDKHLSVSDKYSAFGFINSYNLNAQLLKGNFKWKFAKTVGIGASVINLTSDYSEVMTNSNRNSFSFNNLTVVGEVEFNFGNYVAIKGYALNYQAKRNYNIVGVTDKSDNLSSNVFGGAFEFLF